MIDCELVERSRLGDSAALGELLVLARPLVQGTVRRRCGDWTLREDIVQTILAGVTDGIETLRTAPAFIAWLLGITSNVCRKELARRSRLDRQTTGLSGPAERLSSHLCDPEQLVLHQEMCRELAGAIGRLPRNHRRALLLHEVDGYSYPEVGAMLGAQSDLARIWCFRARRRLQRDLAGLRSAVGVGAVGSVPT